MTNFKALALTALTVATAIAAPAANANAFKFAGMKQWTAQDFAFAGPAVQKIAHQMNQAGIPILDGLTNGFDQCKPDGSGMVTMGFYSPSYNMMVLCTNNGNANKMAETLTHEATHVAQDCRAGLNNDRTATSRLAPAYAASIGQDEVNLVKGNYPADQHDHEYEARFNESNPNRVVAALGQYCF